MTGGSLARRYARAIFDFGASDGSLDAVSRDLSALARTMNESAELMQALTTPATTGADRKAVLVAIAARLGASPTTNRVLDLLLQADRITHLPAIAREVAAMAAARAGVVTAEVVSAAPLSADQLGRIVAGLEKLSGKKVQTSARVDADVLGGVRVKMGDVVYDGTLRSQLTSLQTALAK